MDYVIFFLIASALAIFVLYSSARILEKAGFSGKLALLLLVPIVNIGAIWVFAFKKWPNLKADVEQDLK